MFIIKKRSFNNRKSAFVYNRVKNNFVWDKQIFFFKKKNYLLFQKKLVLLNGISSKLLLPLVFAHNYNNSILNCFSKKNNLFFIYFYQKKYIYRLLNPWNFKNIDLGNTFSFLILKAVNFRKKYISLSLPSKKLIYHSLFLLSSQESIKKKKNLIFKHIFKKPNVRGIAKNPVDHPNGGRSNTKQPLKNKFALIAKKNK